MVPKPAHSGCESWLKSVWAVGWHLSQYSSAVDAFAAPGTCKQLAPQITVICDGARYQPVPQPQADLAPANSTVDRSQSDADMQQVSKHIHWVMPTFSCAVVWPCNTAGLGFLPWGCYVAPVWRARPCTTRRQLYTAASAAWCRLPGMCLNYARHVATQPTESLQLSGAQLRGRNLPTKLARGCAGAQYLWLGYPGRSSGQTQPDSPLQSPEVPCVRWARGAEK